MHILMANAAQWLIYHGHGASVPPAGRQVFFGEGHIFIDLTVQTSCFVTIYIIIWANTQLYLILAFRYLWYAIFKV